MALNIPWLKVELILTLAARAAPGRTRGASLARRLRLRQRAREPERQHVPPRRLGDGQVVERRLGLNGQSEAANVGGVLGAAWLQGHGGSEGLRRGASPAEWSA